MRFKAIPPTPPSRDGESDGLDALATVRDALPLVPRPEGDCCARLVDRISWIDRREIATEWIVFLRALGLAERSDAGYARVRGDLDPDALGERLRDRVVGAEETIDALGDEPRSVDAVFETTRESVPEWERRRDDAWETEWRTRTERLLAWATLLGLAETQDGGYRRRGE